MSSSVTASNLYCKELVAGDASVCKTTHMTNAVIIELSHLTMPVLTGGIVSACLKFAHECNVYSVFLLFHYSIFLACFKGSPQSTCMLILMTLLCS